MAAFGSATPVAAIVGRHFPVWVGSTLRMALAAVVLIPVALLARRGHDDAPRLGSLPTPDRWRLAAVALVGTFGFTVLMLLGMRQAPGSVAAVVMATTPAVTALGAVLFLGDRITPSLVAALALAVAGVLVVNLGGGVDDGGAGNVVVGSLLVFGAVLCEAVYSLAGKSLTASLGPATIATVAAVGALVAFVPLAAWDLVRAGVPTASPGGWAAVVWWGLGTMALGSLLWFAGMRRAEASRAAAFMAVMPVSALVLSYLLLGEPFRWVHVVGIGSVLAGLALAVRGGATVH